MDQNRLLHILALQHIPNIGDITAKKLISHCGSVEAVFNEKKQNLLKIDGIGSLVIKDLFNKQHFLAAEEELQFIADHDIKTLFFADTKDRKSTRLNSSHVKISYAVFCLK